MMTEESEAALADGSDIFMMPRVVELWCTFVMPIYGRVCGQFSFFGALD